MSAVVDNVEGPVKTRDKAMWYLWGWLLNLGFLDTSPGRNLRGVLRKS